MIKFMTQIVFKIFFFNNLPLYLFQEKIRHAEGTQRNPFLMILESAYRFGLGSIAGGL